MSDWRKIKYNSDYMRNVQKYAIENKIKTVIQAISEYNKKTKKRGYRKTIPRKHQKGGKCKFHSKDEDCELYPTECGSGYKELMGGMSGGSAVMGVMDKKYNKKKSQKGCSKKSQKGCSQSQKTGGGGKKILMTDQEYLFAIAAAQIASETKGKKLSKQDIKMMVDERLHELRQKRDPYHQGHYDYVGPLIESEDEDLFSAEESDEQEKRKREEEKERKREKLRKKIKKAEQKKEKLKEKLRKSYSSDSD